MKMLPSGLQYIDDDDIAAVASALQSDFLTTGPVVGKFEVAFSAYVQVPHAVACSNGTAALHLAALALRLGEGDVVVVPSLTFLATANAARYVGAEVIFADVDSDTGLLTPDSLEVALQRSNGAAKAVFPVHLNGQCADMVGLQEISRSKSLALVEDACHALGTRYSAQSARVGSCQMSDMACFSFHPVKTIAMGEGGMVTTANPDLAERLARMRTHGMQRNPTGFANRAHAFAPDGSPNPWYYEMPEVGFNYRAPDINCALGISQLRKIDRFTERRMQLAALYDQLIGDLQPMIRPVTRMPGCSPIWHLYSVLIDFAALKLDRAGVMARLKTRGIGTQVHYMPVHLQPYYRDRYGELSLPGALRYYERQLSLPFFYGMDDEDVERVVTALRDIVNGRL